MTGCDVAAITALAATLSRAPDPMAAAARGWTPLCAGDGALDAQLAQVAPGDGAGARWWLLELQTGMMDARRWYDACPAGGTQALSMATKLGPDQRRAYLWERCDLGRFGAFTADEWEHARGLLVLPVLAAHTLAQGGVKPEAARPIVRALAGISP